jgi:hypothetical protein
MKEISGWAMILQAKSLCLLVGCAEAAKVEGCLCKIGVLALRSCPSSVAGPETEVQLALRFGGWAPYQSRTYLRTTQTAHTSKTSSECA